MSIREMIRRAGLEVGGLGVSTATRPDAPVEPTWAKGSLPPRASGMGSQTDKEDRARVVGFIPLPQGAVQQRSPNRRPWSSDSANESGPRPTTKKKP